MTEDKLQNSGKEEEGNRFHILQVLKMNNNLSDRFYGSGTISHINTTDVIKTKLRNNSS